MQPPRTRRLALAVAVACVTPLLPAAVSGALPPTARITSAGLGPIEIGMTERQVERAGRRAITLEGGSDCATAALGKDVFGLFTRGRLARVDVRSRLYRTRAGIRVGDSQRKVLATYGRALRREPHKYTVGGFYLKLTTGHRRLVFDTDGRRVREIGGGRIPEVDYVEGCA